MISASLAAIYLFQENKDDPMTTLFHIAQNWLIEHREGLIILSGGTQGDVGKKLLKENTAEIESAVAFYQEFFADHFYLALSRTGRPNEERYIQAALKLSERCNLPLVATNDVMFLPVIPLKL